MNSLPSFSPETFSVGWTSQGPTNFDVYVSDNGGDFQALLTDTTATSTSFTGQDGHVYGFDCVETGQPADALPQATTTVDATPPSSSVSTLPTYSPATFSVSWSGQDSAGGSGVASYDVSVSDNGGAFTPLLTGTALTSTSFTGQDGHSYGFYSIAHDNVGNVEVASGFAQALTTVDAVPPTSSVTALPTFSPGSFDVSWSGQDNAGGSGVASYDVYVSDNGGAFTPLLTATTQNDTFFTGQDGHTYGFYSVATDAAGNVESASAHAQATTRVDAVAPTSSVTALPATSPQEFTVSWTGQDNAGGSGVAYVSLYVSDNGSDFTWWGDFDTTTGSGSTTFGGENGHTYGFYTIATDKVGNSEDVPTTAEASTLVQIIPTQLQFGEPPTILAGQASDPITVELQDELGFAAPAGAGGVTVTLSTTSSTGSFLDTNGKPLANNSITIPEGQFDASFEYLDTNNGTPTIKAAALGFFKTQQVDVRSIIALTPSSLPEGSINQFYGADINADDLNLQNVTLTVSNVSGSVSGLTLPTSGTNDLFINGFPTAAGTIKFRVTATDALGAKTVQDYSLTISPIRLTPDPLPDAIAGFDYSQTITATGGTGTTTLTVSNVQNAIAGLNLPTTGNNSLTISGKPSATGLMTFTLTALDSAGHSFQADYTLSVDAMGLSPNNGTSLAGATVGELYSQTISVIGGSGGNSITVNFVTGSIPGLNIPSTGTDSITISGTPTGTGTVSFEVDATDSNGDSTSGFYSVFAEQPFPHSIAFTTPAQTLVAGQASGLITVEVVDQANNPITAGSGGIPVTVHLPKGATVLDTSSKPLTTPIVTIPSGGTTASFKILATVASSNTFVSVSGDGTGGEQTETVVAAAPQNIVFNTGPQGLLAGQPSGTIQIGLIDQFGNVAAAGSGGVTVALASSSATGAFLDSSDAPLASPSITIPQGIPGALFAYLDTTAGKPTLTVSASGLTAAQQQETVAATSSALLVTNTNDSGPGSLRQAITSANTAGSGNIIFAPGVAGTIDLLSKLPALSANVNIFGPGAGLLTVQRAASAGTAFGIFAVGKNSTATISGLTIAHANDTGVYNQGNLTLKRVVVADNHATGLVHLPPFGSPGGILNVGNIIIVDSTIANNTTANSEVAAGIDSEGGSVTILGSTISGNVDEDSNSAGGIGIYGGTLYLAHSTVTGNTAQIPNAGQFSGGGIDASGDSVVIFDSIVAGNIGPAGQVRDVNGTFTSLGHNLIGAVGNDTHGFIASDLVGMAGAPIDAMLGPLQNNGGPTPTCLPQPGSPAIDAGDNADAPSGDQRGLARIANGTIDIGAVEVGGQNVVAITTPSQDLIAGQPSGVMTLQLLDSFGNPVVAGTGGVSVTFSSSASTGQFLDAGGNPLAVANTISVPEGSSSIGFEYEDTAAGPVTLSAAATGFATGSQQESVAPATATHLALTAPAQALVGGTFGVTVRALDPFGNTDLNYTGPAALLLGGSGSGNLSGTTAGQFQAGAVSFNGLSVNAAGSYTLFAAAPNDLAAANAALTVTAATHFSVTVVGSIPAAGLAPGSSVTVKVTALNASNQTVNNYGGTIHLTSSDPRATPLGNYTFTPGSLGDNGSHQFTIQLGTSGRQTIKVTDTTLASAAGTSPQILVAPAAPPAVSFKVTGYPNPDVAGAGHSVIVSAVDAFGNTVTGYTGTVTLTSPGAGLTGPALTYQFQGTDKGSHTFSGITLANVGTWSISAGDGTIAGAESGIVVQSPATALSVGNVPKSVTAGVAFNLTVSALAGTIVDAKFGDTISFATSDKQASGILQGNYIFRPGAGGDNGSRQISFVLETAGTQTITITDLTRPSVKSVVATVQVTYAPAARFQLSGVPTTETVGTPQNVTVKAVDNFGNLVTTYTGAVQLSAAFFSGSGSATGVPANYSFKVSDGGVHKFNNVVLKTIGEWGLEAEDSAHTIFGGASVQVQSPATALSVTGPATAVAGTPFTLTVTALAGTATDKLFSDLIHFASTDANASLPDNYTFQTGSSADNGAHTFTLQTTLQTAGTQNITVTDLTRTGIKSATLKVTVSAAPTVHGFRVTGYPTTTLAGAGHSFTVTAVDASGNKVPGYHGTVLLSGVGGVAGLPTSYTFNPTIDKGSHTFTSVSFANIGAASLTAADQANSSVNGSETNINVATLIAGITGPSGANAGVRGQPLAYTLTATESGAASNAQFTYKIDWDGNGSVDQTITGSSSVNVTHIFPAAGSNNTRLVVTDSTGIASAPAATTAPVGIVPLLLETDLLDSNKTMLVVGGTTVKDAIVITAADATGASVTVSIGGTLQKIGAATTFSPTGHIVVYGQGGGDTIQLASARFNGQTAPVAISAVLFSGGGNSTLSAAGSSANNILVGGAGNDSLTGGSGADILIGGAGADALHAGSGGDVLIAGGTAYDANLSALLALMAEWGSGNTYPARVSNLFGTTNSGQNAPTFLNAQGIVADSAVDQLFGGAGQDWFWLNSGDKPSGQTAGEVLTL